MTVMPDRSIEEEVVEVVRKVVKSGKILKRILNAATLEMPRDPAISHWIAARLREGDYTEGNVGPAIEEWVKLTFQDDLMQRRLQPYWQTLIERMAEKLAAEELDRRVATGELIKQVEDDGQVY